jgi:hypothetical protein
VGDPIEERRRPVSTKLTQLLKSHVALDDTWDGVPEGHVRCNWTSCGFTVEVDEDDHWRDDFAEHVTAVLAAEGFGDLRIAKAEALEEQAATLQARSETYLATGQNMAGSGEHTHDDILRYGAYAAEANTAATVIQKSAAAIRSGK